MKYTMNFESESLEDDLSKVADIVLCAFERYSKIVKENKTQSDVMDLQHDVHGLDNKIDGLEARFNDFREVVVKNKPSDNNNYKK